MKKWVISSLVAILPLLIFSPPADATKCADTESLANAPNKVFTDNCYLHPGAPDTELGGSCPNVDPYLIASTTYRCEECGEMLPWDEFSATGYGQCLVAVQDCLPELHSFTYEATHAEIKVLNRYHLGICLDGHLSKSVANCGCAYCGEDDHTPVLVSLDNGAVQLTSAEEGVEFDLNADGVSEQVAWTEMGSNEAFLALDRNGNGLIDSGAELFGDKTPQPDPETGLPNGFAALAVFDDTLSGGNEDGVIDTSDSIFLELRLWLDQNHNGEVDDGELLALSDAGVQSIDLDYSESPRVDGYGNEFRYWAMVQLDGPVRKAWDVVLQQAPDSGT